MTSRGRATRDRIISCAAIRHLHGRALVCIHQHQGQFLGITCRRETPWSFIRVQTGGEYGSPLALAFGQNHIDYHEREKFSVSIETCRNPAYAVGSRGCVHSGDRLLGHPRVRKPRQVRTFCSSQKGLATQYMVEGDLGLAALSELAKASTLSAK